MSDNIADPHLDDTVLAAIVDGSDPHPEAIAHLSECEDCRRRLSAVSHLVDDKEVSGEIEALERPGSTHRWRRSSIGAVVTLAAAAVAAIVVVGPNGVRGHETVVDSSAMVHREGTITTTAPPRIVSPSSIEATRDSLRWTSVPGADLYRVQIWDTEGSILLTTDIQDTTLALPSNLANAGATYLWEVKARTGWDRWVSSEFLQLTVRAPTR